MNTENQQDQQEAPRFVCYAAKRVINLDVMRLSDGTWQAVVNPGTDAVVNEHGQLAPVANEGCTAAEAIIGAALHHLLAIADIDPCGRERVAAFLFEAAMGLELTPNPFEGIGE